MDGGMRGLPERGEAVEADLVFLDEMDGVPTHYIHDHARDTERFVAKRALVRNGRMLAHETSLDREGFIFLKHDTQVTDFFNDDLVRSDYYAETAEVVQAATGATSVLVFSYSVRSSAKGPRDLTNRFLEPSVFVHNDYTHEAALRRLQLLLTPKDQAGLLQHRFAEYHLWRPIRGPLQTKPLALGDGSTFAPSDIVRAIQYTPDDYNEYLLIKHNPDQRWYYYPDMQPDEAILLKCHDSDRSRTPFSGHGAMDDPGTPPDAPPRESIETRAFAFFAPDWKATPLEPPLARRWS